MKRKQREDSRGTPNKRRALVEDASWGGDTGEFMVGSVVRIRMKDFLTYDDCELEVGPRLNVVIGPNGTGKSTLVCAIAIGLGANLKVLGRAKRESDFIKHGNNQAELEIELKGYPSLERGKYIVNPDCHTVVYHSITRDPPSSEWKFGMRIPGQPYHLKRTTHKDIKALIRNLNVQIENLCQFLPQDRVGAFASMDDKNLLHETLKAVGGGEKLYEELSEMIDIQKEVQDLTVTISQEQTMLDTDRKQNAILAKDVERFLDRQKHLATVRLCSQKKPWILFAASKKSLDEAVVEKKEVELELKSAEKRADPIKKRIITQRNALKTAQDKARSVLSSYKQIQVSREKEHKAFEESENGISSLQDNLVILHNRSEDRQKEAARLEKSIAAKQKAYDNLPPEDVIKKNVDKIKEKIADLNSQLDERQQQRRQLDQQLRRKKMEEKEKRNELQKMKDERQLRERMLNNIDQQAYRAYKWVQSNKNLFESEVLGPIVLDVSIPDIKDAICFERAVPRWLLVGFVVQNEADECVMQRQLVEKQGLAISVVSLFGKSPPVPQRKAPMEYLRKYGIKGWLDELWTAHPALKTAILANTQALYHTAVGSEVTFKHLDKFMADERCKGIPTLFTHDSVYSRKISQYGSHDSSTSVSQLPTNTKFIRPVDMNQLNRLKQELQAILAEASGIQSQISGLMEEEKAISGELMALKQKRNKEEGSIRQRKELQNHLNSSRRDLVELQKEDDTSAEIEQTYKLIARLVQKQYKISKNILTWNEKHLKMEKSCLTLKMNLCTQQAVVRALEEKEKEVSRANKELLARREEVDRRVLRLKDDASRKQRIALEGGALTSALKAKFDELPETIEELDVEMQRAQSKVDSNTHTNSKILEEHETREEHIKQLEETVEEKKKRLSEDETSLQEKKAHWLKEVKTMIAKVSSSFEHSMAKIGCGGRVELHSPGEKFDEFGIRIMVRFRKEAPFQQLKGHSQSGGEKSVATMLYLVSLQPLTPCPFRLVDEINQGMDPRNERMIFDQVVKSACEGRAGEVPQYFLITPKLLPDLQFTKHMRVLIILNGPWQQPFDKWGIKQVTEAKGPQ